MLAHDDLGGAVFAQMLDLDLGMSPGDDRERAVELPSLRHDLAALERIKAAEASREAAIGETKPSVRVNANYGDLGLSIPDSHYTYAVAGTLDIPIF